MPLRVSGASVPVTVMPVLSDEAAGKPVWMLPTYVPDWRWLLGRDDTPWYPTMRLYRQAEDRRWPPVIARIARDLAAAASSA